MYDILITIILELWSALRIKNVFTAVPCVVLDSNLVVSVRLDIEVVDSVKGSENVYSDIQYLENVDSTDTYLEQS